MKTNTEQIFEKQNPFLRPNKYEGHQTKLVFCCTAGLLRSPTAAKVATSLGYNARSCGSNLDYALIPLSKNLLYWGEKIYFMNQVNYFEAQQLFQGKDLDLLEYKKVVWNFEDCYDYDDWLLKEKVKELL